jgi:hypothetical protein
MLVNSPIQRIPVQVKALTSRSLHLLSLIGFLSGCGGGGEGDENRGQEDTTDITDATPLDHFTRRKSLSG